jgi:hypothetical protein
VTVSMAAPAKEGNYIAFFRFVHGDNNRFGQKVWCDVMVKPAPELHESPIKPVEQQKEEKSSLLNDSIEHPSPAIENVDFKFEMVIPEQEPAAEVKEVDFLDLLSQESVKPPADLKQSQFEEKEDSKQEEVPVVVAEKNPLMKSEPSAEDLEKIAYMEKLAEIKDPKIAENLKTMLDMGYTNFEVNHSLLKRNQNDIIIAMNSLCNGMISESMFLQ